LINNDLKEDFTPLNCLPTALFAESVASDRAGLAASSRHGPCWRRPCALSFVARTARGTNCHEIQWLDH
jgi:hypothetical protein